MIEAEMYNHELKLIEMYGIPQAYSIVQEIVTFLKENQLSLGYTNGTTASSLFNYKIGLSKINPLDFDLIFERNIIPTPYFGISLDKNSFDKLNTFLKKKKISEKFLEELNIKLIYDERIDNIQSHKALSYKELSTLATKIPSDNGLHKFKNFNEFADWVALYKLGVQKYWFKEITYNSFLSLANDYYFLKCNNSFGVILYQEEWMSIIKTISGLSFLEVNKLRNNLSENKGIKKVKNLLSDCLDTHTKDKDKIVNVLMSCRFYSPVKAHIIANSYIKLAEYKVTKSI